MKILLLLLILSLSGCLNSNNDSEQDKIKNLSETSQQDLRIDFWPFDAKDEYNAFPHQIDIYSVLDE